MKKNNYKTCLVFGIIILLIGAGVVPNISSETNNDSTSFEIKNNRASNQLLLQSKNIEPVPSPSPAFGDHIAYNYSGDQVHPTFGRTDTGVLMAAYYDVDNDTIYWGNSSDDGFTFGNESYWDIGGDYPSIKHWEGTQFFGTFVTDPDDLSGGATYLFNCSDPTDNNTYNLSYWDWHTEYGWYGMIDADIACDNSQNDWEWGVSSYVISSTYGDGYTNGSTIVYADPSDEELAYIEWYDYNGCAHTDIDIDPVTHQMYAVYDWYNETSEKWELLVWEKDFVNVTDEGEIFQFGALGNLKYPAVAAYDGHIIVLVETDKNGNKDVICYYSDNGVDNLSSVFIVDTDDDERYPDVRHFQDESFICTFVKNNNLYGVTTADGGEYWATAQQINENDGDVIEEYKCSDLCEKASKVMWEGDCDDSGNVDIGIFIKDAFTNDPPNTPGQPSGLASGDICISYDYTTSATDPDGDQLYYQFDWDDGTYSDWVGPYNSGETASASHSWNAPDTYNIKVKAKDVFGEESSWSDSFTVTISNNAPYTPSNPDPENNEIEVNIGADLSWTGGDPDTCDTVTYDVYFGTTSPPQKIITNQSGTTYNPGILNHFTTYYWQIIAWDNHDVFNASPIWNFTTIDNTAPYEPSAPYPANGSIDISTTVIVNWTGGDPDPDDIVTYDVYFGTNTSPTLVANNISDTSYDPGTLEYETTYYWQIVAWDNIGQSTKGPLWEFTTRTQNIPPTVNITKPGKAIYINDEERIPFFITIIIKQITIEVEATDPDDGVEKVEFYLNNKLVGTDEASVNGIYSWTWEKRQFLRWRYTIKVVAYDSENSVEKSIKVIRFR